MFAVIYSVQGSCESYIVEVLNACPQTVQHVCPLLVVLRVRIQVAVVTGDTTRGDRRHRKVVFLQPLHCCCCYTAVSFSPVADFLDLLPNLVAPEGDEKHHILANLALETRKNMSSTAETRAMSFKAFYIQIRHKPPQSIGIVSNSV